MTAKIFRLADYRLRRQGALAPGWALERALRAVSLSGTTDFMVNASTFQRVFREELAKTRALQATKPAPGDDEP
jgi:hypothetical protein